MSVMTAIHGDRVRRLMVQNHLSVNELLARLRQTDDNERVNRGTLSGVINNSYRAKPSAHLVLGLAQTLETTTDYLLGLADEQDPHSEELARKYAQADEEQLLIWLEEKSPELAEMMRAILQIPEEEQRFILDALVSDMRAIHSGEALRIKGNVDE
jgi:transcriptional regulator with XRE-family HTH domain